MGAVSNATSVELDGDPLFEQSRLRSYRHQLQSLADPHLIMDNILSVRQYETAQSHPELLRETAVLDTAEVDLGSMALPAGLAPESYAGAVPNAMGVPGAAARPSEQSIVLPQVEELHQSLHAIGSLRSEIASIEAVIAAFQRHDEKVTVSGKRLPTLPSQAVLKQRAQDLIKLRQEQRINPRAALSKAKELAAHTYQPDFAAFFKGNQQYATSLKEVPVPSSRRDAVMLATALDEVLPAGAVVAKYRTVVRNAEEAISLYTDVLRIRKDFKIVDVTLREAARLIASQCVDRARVVEKIRTRYAEIFNVLVYVSFMVNEALTQFKRKADEMQRKWDKVIYEMEAAKAQAASERELRQQQAERLAAKEQEFETFREAMASDMAELRYENRILTSTMETERAEFKSQLQEKDIAIANMHKELQEELDATRDERDELQQRVRITERQLARLKRPEAAVVTKETVTTQTERVYIYSQPQLGVRGGSDRRGGYDKNESESSGDESDSSRADRRRPQGGHAHSVSFDSYAQSDDVHTGARRRSRQRETSDSFDAYPDDHTPRAAHAKAAAGKQGRRDRQSAKSGVASASSPRAGAKARRSQSDIDLESEPSEAESGSDLEAVDEEPLLEEAEASEQESASEGEPDIVQDEGMSEEEFQRLVAEKAARKAERDKARAERAAERAAARQAAAAIRKAELEEAREARKEQKRMEREAKAAARRAEKAAAKERARAEREQRKQERQAALAESDSGDEEDDDDEGGERRGRKKGRGRGVVISRSAPPGIGHRHTNKTSFEKTAKATLSRKANKAKRASSKVANLGGFTGMFKVKKKGRIKGAAWLMKTIVNIYSDYLVQEHNMSRDGVRGQYNDFNDFVYQWHMSKFGLKQIAEMNLVDLIATVQQNTQIHKVQVFGSCINVLSKEEGEQGTLDHMDFYLSALRLLAGKKPVQTLFTTDDKVEIPVPHVTDGLKGISVELRDDSLKDQIFQTLSLKESTKGAVPLNSLTPLLMEAFHKRWKIAQLHQSSLVAAVDMNNDGMITWDEFSMAAELMSQTGDASAEMDRSVVFKAFTEACRAARTNDECRQEDARLKLRKLFGRLWSLQKQLPSKELVLNDDGVWALTESYAVKLQGRVAELEGTLTLLTSRSKFNPTAMTQAVEMFEHFQAMMRKADFRSTAIEVPFMAAQVVDAMAASMMREASKAEPERRDRSPAAGTERRARSPAALDRRSQSPTATKRQTKDRLPSLDADMRSLSGPRTPYGELKEALEAVPT